MPGRKDHSRIFSIKQPSPFLILGMLTVWLMLWPGCGLEENKTTLEPVVDLTAVTPPADDEGDGSGDDGGPFYTEEMGVDPNPSDSHGLQGGDGPLEVNWETYDQYALHHSDIDVPLPGPNRYRYLVNLDGVLTPTTPVDQEAFRIICMTEGLQFTFEANDDLIALNKTSLNCKFNLQETITTNQPTDAFQVTVVFRGTEVASFSLLVKEMDPLEMESMEVLN